MSEDVSAMIPKRRAESANYYRKNRQRILARNKLHYDAHRKEKSEYWAARYEHHKHEIDCRNKAYRLAHPKKIALLSKAWQKSHPTSVALAKHRWYLKNKEREKKRHAQYAKKRPEIYILASQKRRALKRAAVINLASIKEWMALIKSKSHVKCYYCEQHIDTNKIHFDHIIPLSLGGYHSVENLCVACGPCNLSKHSKRITAWVKVGQQILSL